MREEHQSAPAAYRERGSASAMICKTPPGLLGASISGFGPQRGFPEMQRDAASSCQNGPRRCYGSGLAAGEDILLDDRVNAPISIHYLGDAEVDANRNQGDRFILGQLLGRHQKLAHLAERIAQ